jgi:hypothetical protein
MADRLSLGGFGFTSQICSFYIFNIAQHELQMQTKLFYPRIPPPPLTCHFEAKGKTVGPLLSKL